MATDGGGSIRAPAAAAGVFGFKARFGRVPGYPPAHTGTVFHVEPVTRRVTEAALLLNVISGWDARDWFSLPHDGRDWRVGLQDGVAGLRIAYSRTLGYLQVDPEVAGLVDKAVARFAELGAIVEDTDPGFENPAPIHQVMWTVGAAKLLRGIALERHELIETGLREVAQRSAAITTAQYLDALDRRMELGIHQRRFHQRYDLLLTPVLSAPVPISRRGAICAVLLTFQSHPTTGRQRAVWLHRQRFTGRLANRWSGTSRRSRAACCASL